MFNYYSEQHHLILKRFLFAAWICLVFALAADAQTPHPSLNHKISDHVVNGALPNTFSSVPETLRVLVALVEFQPDNEPRTTGNGTFDLSQPVKPIIDPPPHNKSYTEYHMTFVENYFRKVSGGKFIVKATVLDSVYRLQHPMAYYSPPRSSTNNAQLGYLTTDTWHTVDSLTPAVNFQQYGAFIIFHAGVGRDIDLTSQLGYDPGPFDIPSVYMNLQSLRKIFDSSYAGVPVNGGTFYIKNSLIIPETESRLVSGGFGSTLLELGINGLLAASIGSHKGLPDLFDTKTGRSGIGRFGLMDGQAIFSWSGVFPPEPSAWEKYFLGWIAPITVQAGNATLNLPSARSGAAADTVYRVLISAKEYFLVENRNRDAHRDGSIVTLVRNDVTTQRTFLRDTSFFNAFSQDSIYGVVTDVDEFDWSLPGHTNTSTGEWFDGGILIWHIDENIIEANYANDAVNANPNRRGVNLMEADGSQDIGQSYDFISPGFGSEEGRYVDYWYQGNQSTPRTLSNEFNPNSLPNSLSNDFANSHVYMKNFSARGPHMSLTIRVGDDQVAPFLGFPKYLPSLPGKSSVLPADLNGDGISELVLATSGKISLNDTVQTFDGEILAFNQNGSSYFTAGDSSGKFIRENLKSFDPPIAFDINGDDKDDIVTVRHPSQPGYTTADLRIFSPLDVNIDGNPDVLWGTRYGIASTASLLRYQISAGDSVITWAGTGSHLLLLRDTSRVHSTGNDYTGLASTGRNDAFFGIDLLDGLERFDSSGSISRIAFTSPLSGSPALADLDGNGLFETALLSRDGKVYLIDSSGTSLHGFPYDTHHPISSSPAIGTLTPGGPRAIVVTAGTKVYAFNVSGALIDNFPVSVKTNYPIDCSPVLADVDGDGNVDVLLVTHEGMLCAYRPDGKMVAGFPLQLGGNVLTSLSVFRTTSGSTGIAAACEDRNLYAWELPARFDNSPHPWPMYLHDSKHSGIDRSPLGTPAGSSDFLPAVRAYNWPNPVTSADGFTTHIRYFVASDARVNIKIFDMAGDLVAELSGNAIGGVDNEMEWNVRNIQSGVYFGQIDAQGASASGHAVIKIAVVK